MLRQRRSRKPLYFPLGVLSRARVLPDRSAEQRIQDFLKWSGLLSLLSLNLVGFMFGLKWLPVVAALLVAWCYFGIRAHLSGYAFSSYSHPLVQSYAAAPDPPSKLGRWFTLAACIALVACGSYAISQAEVAGDVLMAGLSVLVFGACAGMVAYVLRAHYP